MRAAELVLFGHWNKHLTNLRDQIFREPFLSLDSNLFTVSLEIFSYLIWLHSHQKIIMVSWFKVIWFSTLGNVTVLQLFNHSLWEVSITDHCIGTVINPGKAFKSVNYSQKDRIDIEVGWINLYLQNVTNDLHFLVGSLYLVLLFNPE